MCAVTLVEATRCSAERYARLRLACSVASLAHASSRLYTINVHRIVSYRIVHSTACAVPFVTQRGDPVWSGVREAPFWVAGCYRAACSYTQQSSTAGYTSPQLGIRLHPLPFPNSKLNKAHVGPTIVWPRGSAHTREPRLRSLRVLCPPFPSGLLRSSIDGTPPFATESWCAHLWLWLWRQQGRSSSPPAPRLRSRRARRQPSSAASASLAPVADVRRRHVPTRAELSSHPLLLAARRGRDTAPSPVASPPPGPRRRSLRALAAARRQPLTPLPPLREGGGG